jgi:hypothetical protein
MEWSMNIITFLWLAVAAIIAGSAIARAVIRWKVLQFGMAAPACFTPLPDRQLVHGCGLIGVVRLNTYRGI